MLAAYGGRTQAGIDLRASQHLLAQSAKDMERHQIIAAQKQAANEAIAAGRAAAARFRLRELEAFKRDMLDHRHQAQIVGMERIGPVKARRSDYAPTYAKIERRICKALNIDPKDIKADRRSRNIVFARQAITYWAVRLTNKSLPQIGRLMNRDHSTCLHSKRTYPVKRASMGRHLRQVL